MAYGRVGRYEMLFLRPLSILFPITAVVYFFQKSWGVGLYFLLAWLYIGLVGQSLNRHKALCELTEGQSEKDDSWPTRKRKKPLSQSEASLVCIAAFQTTLTLDIAVLIIGLHNRTPPWRSLLVAFGVGLVYFISSVLIAINPFSVARDEVAD